jgi:hypothetical protein
VLALGLLGVALWSAPLWMAGTAGHDPPGQGAALLAALLGCLFLAVRQQRWSPSATSDDEGVHGFLYRYVSAAGLFMIGVVVLSADRERRGLPWDAQGLLNEPEYWFWFVAILVYVPVLTDLLPPEVIARWRGANLLFPTRRRLWLQRLLLVPAGVAVCLLLGWLTAFLARLVVPAG